MEKNQVVDFLPYARKRNTFGDVSLPTLKIFMPELRPDLSSPTANPLNVVAF